MRIDLQICPDGSQRIISPDRPGVFIKVEDDSDPDVSGLLAAMREFKKKYSKEPT